MCRKQDRGTDAIRAPVWQPQPGEGSGQPLGLSSWSTLKPRVTAQAGSAQERCEEAGLCLRTLAPPLLGSGSACTSLTCPKQAFLHRPIRVPPPPSGLPSQLQWCLPPQTFQHSHLSSSVTTVLPQLDLKLPEHQGASSLKMMQHLL